MDISELYIRHIYYRGHVESLAATARDGTQLFLDASSVRCDADGSRRLEENLREAQALLGMPPEVIRRQGTLKFLDSVLFRQPKR
jgi:hypothetical protein